MSLIGSSNPFIEITHNCQRQRAYEQHVCTMNGGKGIERGGRKSSELIPQEDCLLANSVAFPGEAKRNCFMIIHSLFPSSFTFTFLPQIHREFLKVLDVYHFSLEDVERRTDVGFFKCISIF